MYFYKNNEKYMIGLYVDYKKTPDTIPEGFDTWDIVRNFDDFCNSIILHYNTEHKLHDLISFNNYLGEESLDGIECARWLLEYCSKNKILVDVPIIIHCEEVEKREMLSHMFKDYKKYNNLEDNVEEIQIP